MTRIVRLTTPTGGAIAINPDAVCMVSPTIPALDAPEAKTAITLMNGRIAVKETFDQVTGQIQHG